MKRHCVCLQLKFKAPKRTYLGNSITSGGLKWQCIVNATFSSLYLTSKQIQQVSCSNFIKYCRQPVVRCYLTLVTVCQAVPSSVQKTVDSTVNSGLIHWYYFKWYVTRKIKMLWWRWNDIPVGKVNGTNAVFMHSYKYPHWTSVSFGVNTNFPAKH